MNDLSPEELAIHEWQLDVPGFGTEGQQTLKHTTALVSRCGGLGGPVTFSLAAAGVGELIIAHAGNLKHSDYNRQICARYEDLGKNRLHSMIGTLSAFKPQVTYTGIDANIGQDNASELVERADIVFSCAPLFVERFAMNAACVEHGVPMVDASMYGMEGQVIVVIPGETACLSCIYPEDPPAWKRKFPVLGAVSALAAQIAVLEGIKLLTGCGEVIKDSMLYYDSATMNFMRVPTVRRADCPVCGAL